MNIDGIGSAVPSDLEVILRLIGLQFGEHGIEVDGARLRAAVSAVLADDTLGAFLLARNGGDTVGVAYISLVWALEHCGRAAWLEELYVIPAARGHGIGRELLEGVLTYLRQRGCGAVDLEVEESHARAENLYRRAGFEAHTRRRWFLRLAE